MVQEQFLLCILIRLTIFEHSVQKEKNTDNSGFIFQEIRSGKWNLKYRCCRRPPKIFWLSNMLIRSNYFYIKDTNFCKYKFWGYRFSEISPLKFLPKLQHYVNNDMQNFMMQNLSSMFYANLFQPIFTIWS